MSEPTHPTDKERQRIVEILGKELPGFELVEAKSKTGESTNGDSSVPDATDEQSEVLFRPILQAYESISLGCFPTSIKHGLRGRNCPGKPQQMKFRRRNGTHGFIVFEKPDLASRIPRFWRSYFHSVSELLA
jgi:hypothetical protein